MEGLVEEGSEVLEAEGPGPIIDSALIAAAQRVEHYEIAAYGTARTLAEHLGHADVVELLQETLEEESAADEKLTSISEDEILPAASSVEEVAHK
jgi:ferritin-like metal-binding protein YciE